MAEEGSSFLSNTHFTVQMPLQRQLQRCGQAAEFVDRFNNQAEPQSQHLAWGIPSLAFCTKGRQEPALFTTCRSLIVPQQPLSKALCSLVEFHEKLLRYQWMKFNMASLHSRGAHRIVARMKWN